MLLLCNKLNTAASTQEVRRNLTESGQFRLNNKSLVVAFRRNRADQTDGNVHLKNFLAEIMYRLVYWEDKAK